MDLLSTPGPKGRATLYQPIVTNVTARVQLVSRVIN